MQSMKRALTTATVLGAFLISPAVSQTLVVGNKNDDTVGFIDLRKDEMVATRSTGHQPHEVAISPNGKVAAVVAYGWGPRADNRIFTYDIATAKQLKEINLGEHARPHGILWLPDGRHVVATTEGKNHLVIVDTKKGKIVDTVATTQESSHMVALSPDAKTAYVANIKSDSITVIDLERKKHVANLPSGRESEGIAVTPDGSEIWVSNRAEDTLSVFDAETLEIKTKIDVGRMPIRVAISPDGAYAVTSNARESSLTIVDISSKEIAATIDLKLGGVPITVYFHPDGDKFYVSLTYSGEIVVVERSHWDFKGSVIGHPPGMKVIEAGQGADGLGYTAVNLEVTE